MAHPILSTALALMLVTLAGCGSRTDEAQMKGQLMAAEVAAAKAVAAQKAAERAAASVAEGQVEPDDTIVEDDSDESLDNSEADVFDNTIVSPPAPEPAPAR